MCEESNRSFASETAPQAGKTLLRLSVAERGAPPLRTARPVVGLRSVLSTFGLLRIVSEPNERFDSDVHVVQVETPRYDNRRQSRRLTMNYNARPDPDGEERDRGESRPRQPSLKPLGEPSDLLTSRGGEGQRQRSCVDAAGGQADPDPPGRRKRRDLHDQLVEQALKPRGLVQMPC